MDPATDRGPKGRAKALTESSQQVEPAGPGAQLGEAPEGSRHARGPVELRALVPRSQPGGRGGGTWLIVSFIEAGFL